MRSDQSGNERSDPPGGSLPGVPLAWALNFLLILMISIWQMNKADLANETLYLEKITE